MSSYLIEPYTVPLREDLEYKGEFILYLKTQMTWAVKQRLSILKQSGNFPEELTFHSNILPIDSVKNPKEDSTLSLISSLSNEERDDIDGLEEEVEMVEQLETLSPDNPIGFDYIFNVEELVSNILDQLSGFRVTAAGRNLGEYFGIQQDLWYFTTPFRISDTMKSLDFGTPDIPSFRLFYPAFTELRQNFDLYYNTFIQERGELIVNDKKL